MPMPTLEAITKAEATAQAQAQAQVKADMPSQELALMIVLNVICQSKSFQHNIRRVDRHWYKLLTAILLVDRQLLS